MKYKKYDFHFTSTDPISITNISIMTVNYIILIIGSTKKFGKKLMPIKLFSWAHCSIDITKAIYTMYEIKLNSNTAIRSIYSISRYYISVLLYNDVLLNEFGGIN